MKPLKPWREWLNLLLESLILFSCRQRVRSLVTIWTVNVYTAVCFLCQGYLPKLGLLGKRRRFCKVSYLFFYIEFPYLLYLHNVVTLLNWLILHPFQDWVCTTRHYFANSWWSLLVLGRALLSTHRGIQILSQLLLSSELGVPHGKLQVLMAHCIYWKVLSKLWPEVGGVRTASLPSLSEVSATHSPACVAMETLPWWLANSDHFSENNLMQSTETWGLQLPHTHRYTHSCNCLLCVMISASEQTNLLVRQEHVSQRGWLQTWLSPAQINKTSSCCLEQCIVTTTGQLVKQKKAKLNPPKH